MRWSFLRKIRAIYATKSNKEMKKDNIVIVLDAKQIIKNITYKYGKHPNLNSTYASVKESYEKKESKS